MIAASVLDGLRTGQPEWSPWLDIVQEVLVEIGEGRWSAIVLDAPRGTDARAALLSGATVRVDPRVARQFFQRVIRRARRSRLPKLASVERLESDRLDVVSLIQAALAEEHDRALPDPAGADADRDASLAILSLLPVPLLHACRTRLAPHVPDGWLEGSCPVCAAWPAFAEARGVERQRYFRCGRCGMEWHSRLLRCPYCAEDRHQALASLVPDGNPAAVIDACTRCGGYVKAFTVLQGWSPELVMLQDLGTVHLDLAALQLGYRRPDTRAVDVRVTTDGTSVPRPRGWMR